MAYSPQSWSDGPDGGTPISAERLLHMETGIDSADSLATNAANIAAAALAAATAGPVMSVDGATGDVVLSDTYAAAEDSQITSSSHSPALHITKQFPASSLPGEPALRIEDDADDPDLTGQLIEVYANTSAPSGRKVFGVSRYGGVNIWDFLQVVPSATPSNWGDAMVLVGSDLSSSGLNMALHNVQNHDFLAMTDSDGNQVGMDHVLNAKRFIFTGAGLLAFGNKLSSIPALKPSGAVLTVRKADDSGYAELYASKLRADDIRNVADSGSIIQLGQSITVSTQSAAHVGFRVIIAGTAAADHIQVLSSDGSTIFSRFNKGGYFMTRKTSAPADADLASGEMALWFDSTNGAAKLMVKAKQADGTVRAGEVALS